MECFYEKRRQPRSNINIFNITVIPFSRIVMHLFFYNDTINNIKDIYNEERIIEISQGSFYGARVLGGLASQIIRDEII